MRCFGTHDLRYILISNSCFYTPFGVRCFGTPAAGAWLTRRWRTFLYALRREVLRNKPSISKVTGQPVMFLYALRREVLRNLDARGKRAAMKFLYALRREVLRNVPLTWTSTPRCARKVSIRPSA